MTEFYCNRTDSSKQVQKPWEVVHSEKRKCERTVRREPFVRQRGRLQTKPNN